MKRLICAMISVILFLTFCLMPRAYASGWSITVQTNKPHYYYGDKVNISGILTYNGYPVQSIDISIIVKSSNSTYHIRTVTTDANGEYSDTFTLAGPSAILGTYTVNVTSNVADLMVTNQTTFQLVQAAYITAVFVMVWLILVWLFLFR